MGNSSSCSCGCCVPKLAAIRNLKSRRSSFFGEDAFYRENFPRRFKRINSISSFYDAEEGDACHDSLFQDAQKDAPKHNSLFKELKEQAHLKTYKARVWASSIHTMLFHSSGKDNQPDRQPDRQLSTRTPSSRELTGTDSRVSHFASASVSHFSSASSQVSSMSEHEWYGRTLKQLRQDSQPSQSEGPSWSASNGEDLKVRCGPNYRTNNFKTDSQGSLYQAISCDAVKSDIKIENVVGRLLPNLPAAPAGQKPAWTKDCGLPRIICLNVMFPYQGGLTSFNPLAKVDPGCSFIGLFQVRPETLESLESSSPPAAVTCFKKFCKGPAGLPGSTKTDPNRSLAQRVVKGIKKECQSGLFKATAYCMNARSINVPEMLHRFNGKPCLITKSGYIIRDPAGEWLEIGIDVRGFCTLALSMMSTFRHLLPQAHIHFGFMIQASEDEEMPEEILCDMSVFHVDMVEDPIHIDA